VFPRAGLFRGDFYGDFPIAALVGWRGTPVPASEVSASTVRLAVAGETDRWLTDPVGFWSLYAGSLTNLRVRLADVPRTSDGHPQMEFLAARSHAGGSGGVLAPFTGPRWIRFLESMASESDDLYPDLSPDARKAMRGGFWLQTAGALWREGRAEGASRALERAAELIPRRLLADAPEDPSAASVWVP